MKIPCVAGDTACRSPRWWWSRRRSVPHRSRRARAQTQLSASACEAKALVSCAAIGTRPRTRECRPSRWPPSGSAGPTRSGPTPKPGTGGRQHPLDDVERRTRYEDLADRPDRRHMLPMAYSRRGICG
jgi:hypothetical protein